MINTIQENIKKLRIKMNMSQEEFADMLNVSRSTVAKWETNKSAFSTVFTLVRLCDVCNVSLDDLVKKDLQL